MTASATRLLIRAEILDAMEDGEVLVKEAEATSSRSITVRWRLQPSGRRCSGASVQALRARGLIEHGDADSVWRLTR